MEDNGPYFIESTYWRRKNGVLGWLESTNLTFLNKIIHIWNVRRRGSFERKWRKCHTICVGPLTYKLLEIQGKVGCGDRSLQREKEFL